MKNPWKQISSINPQTEDGFCRISNSVLDALTQAHMTKAEYKVCLAIIRLTWGWNKTEDAISFSQLAQKAGLTTRTVKYTVKLLKDKRIIYYEPSKKVKCGSPMNLYLFNKHYDTWLADGVKDRVRVKSGVSKSEKRRHGVVKNSVSKGERDGKEESLSSSVHAGSSASKDILPDTSDTKDIIKHSLAEKSDHQSLIDHWCRKYSEFYGVKYDFKDGKDGAIVKRLLKIYGLDGAVELIETMFASSDPFYQSGGGRTLAVLSANSNKLAQECIRIKSGFAGYSEKTQKSIRNMEKVLKSMEE
ncbi:MAG: replication protein [Candidatus Zixiibacteriota bacterium]